MNKNTERNILTLLPLMFISKKPYDVFLFSMFRVNSSPIIDAKTKDRLQMLHMEGEEGP